MRLALGKGIRRILARIFNKPERRVRARGLQDVVRLGLAWSHYSH